MMARPTQGCRTSSFRLGGVSRRPRAGRGFILQESYDAPIVFLRDLALAIVDWPRAAVVVWLIDGTFATATKRGCIAINIAKLPDLVRK